ncbi:MAG: PulJ/GspJ family protein [Telluria sp.]
MRRQAGFSLLELVMAMVLIAIIGAIMAVFLHGPFAGIRDTKVRTEVTSAANTALRRMGREVRLALPNSAVAVTNGIQFLLTRTGGRYQATDDNASSGNAIDASGSTSFTIISDVPTGREAIQANDYIVINNYGLGYADAVNAYKFTTSSASNVARVSAISGRTVTLASNPFAQSGAVLSASHRFFVVTGAVWFVCNTSDNTLRRYYSTTIPTSNVTPTGSYNVLANNVSACSFRYDVSNALTHTGLVSMSITMSKTGLNVPITLTYQVNIPNSP